MSIFSDQRPVAAAEWRAEAGATLRLAAPLVLTQLAQVAIRTIDTIMMGWLGAEDLAGGALGINFYFPLYLFGLGIGVAVVPMTAQALGARQFRGVRRSVRQGLWAVTAFGLLFGVLIWNAAPILLAFGQDAGTVVLAERYLHAAVWGFVPSLWIIALRSFVIAHARPRAVLAITILGAVLHGIVAYTLMFGRLGFPALGLVGAGISNAVVHWVMFLALLGFIQRDRRFRRYLLWARLWRPDWPRFLEVLRIGLPIGLTILAESGLFATAVYLMGVIGKVELAAHAIALQCAAVAFMVPLGVAQVATVRVGLALGAGDRAGVGRAGWTAIALAAAFSLLPAAAFLLVPRSIVGIFLDPALPENLPVMALAGTLLAIAGMFQLFDGLQVVAAGALRGLKDTRTPMWIAIVGYWPIGLGACLLLAFPLGWGAPGIWSGLALGLIVVAAFMVLRFHRRDRYCPGLAAP